MKVQKEKISVVTCYDSAFAGLINETSIDMVLVGDSVGNVALGFSDTIPVTVDMMIHHTAAVSRVLQGPLLIADLPFMSYSSPQDACQNAARLLREGGAGAVKLEGGAEVVDSVRALVQAGIPVVGHLGLTPQKVHQLGGYKVQGRGEAGQVIIEEAKMLQEAGCTALVLELVPDAIANEITKLLDIPTIGIGAGAGTDGQVLVLHDLLGLNEDFKPKFVKKYANLSEIVKTSLEAYSQEVKDGVFPAEQHTFK